MPETRVKSKTSFKAQLESYSQEAIAQFERPGNSAGVRNWVSYSVAALSAFAAVGAADAAVIYSGIRNITSGPNLDGPGLPGLVDIDGDGLIELNILAYERASRFGVGMIRATPGAGIELVYVTSNFEGDAVKFSASQSVVPGAGFGRIARLATNTFRGKSGGNFRNSSSGFAGFRFNPGDGNHYGWIRLHIEDLGSNQNGLTDTVTAVDWAYESEIDTPIQVGDKGTSVPEPSSLAIVGLAMGCAALPALRRRRQLQKAAASQAIAQLDVNV